MNGNFIYGVNSQTRKHFLLCFNNKYEQSNELGLVFNSVLELTKNNQKKYIRNMMNAEDRGFIPTIRNPYT